MPSAQGFRRGTARRRKATRTGSRTVMIPKDGSGSPNCFQPIEKLPSIYENRAALCRSSHVRAVW